MVGKSLIPIILISIGVILLTSVQGKKIPNLIKKLNKALGLAPKSEQLWNILPDIANLQSSDATQSASIRTNANDITNLQSSDVTHSADIAANLASIKTNNKDITNLKSCQTRWNIDCNGGVWQQSARDYAGHVCSNWYGWNGNADIGSISTTFNGVGRAQLDFGNCWTSGTFVNATLDGTVIASAPINTPSMTVEFDFDIGSILKIAEHGILQFNSLNIIQCNGENDDACENQHMKTLLDYSAVDPANVPQNISDYWELNVDRGQWTSFVNWPIAAPLCNYNSWFGLLNDDANGYIKTKLEGFGTARLDFGNCWTSGTVKVLIDGIEIASAPVSTPNKIVEFAFNYSELEIREEGIGILVFNSFEVLTCQATGNVLSSDVIHSADIAKNVAEIAANAEDAAMPLGN